MYVVVFVLLEEFFYVGFNKGDIWVRDYFNMEEVLRFGCGKVVVKCLVVYDDEVISVYYDYKIRVWCCLKNDFK